MRQERSWMSSTILLMSVVIVTKLLGFVKQAVIAAMFGAGSVTDTFFVTSSFVVSCGNIVLAALSVALLSEYIKSFHEGGRGASSSLISNVFAVAVFFSVILSVFFFIFADFIAGFLAPGLDRAAVARSLRLLSIVVPFLSCILIHTTVLEAEKFFSYGHLLGIISSVLLISVALIFAGKKSVAPLILAFILAYVVSSILLLLRAKPFYTLRVNRPFRDVRLRKLLALMLPLMLSSATHEINLVVDKNLCSGLGSGAISSLDYSVVLDNFIITVFINSIAIVMFSHVTTWVAEKQFDKIKENVNSGIIYCLMAVIPVQIVTLTCSSEIITVLYGRGSFGATAIATTSAALWGYAIGIVGQAFYYIVLRVFYAFQDTRTPTIISSLAVGVNIVLSIVLSKLWGVMGISLATSIANIFIAVCLTIIAFKKHHNIFDVGFLRQVLSLLPAAVVCAVATCVAKLCLPYSPFWLLVVVTVIAMFAYLVTLLVQKNRYLLALITFAQNKFIHKGA